MPGYETVPLEHEGISVAAVQMNSINIDPKNPEAGKTRNLEYMLRFCDIASMFGGPKQLLVFPEFSITGHDTFWTREEWKRIAIMVPGPETDLIAQKAKELNCYIAIGAHTQDRDWPGHFFNCSVLISPTAGVIHTHWKAYHGFPGVGLEYATDVHSVLDKFIEKYGWDGAWPVAKTPIGNIATYICSEGFAPETSRMFAFNGAEIICRCISGGGPDSSNGRFRLQFRADCAANQVYGIYANKCTRRGIGSMGGGGSMIVDPNGTILAQSQDAGEQVISATIPISLHRNTHYLPNIKTEVYAPMYERHSGQFPPNLYIDYLPNDYEDAKQWAYKHQRDDRPNRFTVPPRKNPGEI
ncbi:nitrilase-related carbon-nitrogen hydrolase [Chloroflexota bacterium]